MLSRGIRHFTVSVIGAFSLVHAASCGEDSRTPAQPTPVTPPAIEASLLIPQTWTADLDRPLVGAPMPDVDLWFEAETATERYLSPPPWTSSTMALVGKSAPGRAGCEAAPLRRERLAIEALSKSDYLCVLTTAGRYSEVRIEEVPGPYLGSGQPLPALRIAIVTYNSGS